MVVLLLCLLAYDDGELQRVEIDQLNKTYDGKRILIEGIFSHIGGQGDERQMQLRNCTAMFVVPQAKLITQSPEGNLEIVGIARYNADKRKVYVYVQSFSKIASNIDRFNERAGAIGATDSAAWFALSDWAARRHKLYGDAEMAAKSLEAYRSGIGVLRKGAAGDPVALSALKARVLKEDKWKDFDSAAVDHEILRAELAKVPTNDPQKLLAFVETLKQRLPGAGEPNLRLPDIAKRRAYDRRPIEFFDDETDVDERKMLARYLYNKLISQYLQLLRTQEQRAPFELGKLAKSLSPDSPEEARKWFRDYAENLETRLSEFDANSLNQAADSLAAELPDYDAARLRNDWLVDREDQLKKADAKTAELAENRNQVATRDADD
jgi:hypothetical protein